MTKFLKLTLIGVGFVASLSAAQAAVQITAPDGAAVAERACKGPTGLPVQCKPKKPVS